MPDIHVTRELLQAWERSELELPRLLSIGIDHLTQCCPHCAREFSAWARNRSNGEAPLRTLQSLTALLEQQGEHWELASRQAQRDLRTLERVPAGERMGRVRRARKRFASHTLAALSLEKAKRYLPDEPAKTFHWARLAEEVLLRSAISGPTYATLQVQLLAHQGNALRAQGSVREAESYLQRARDVLRREGVTDLLVCAEVDCMEGLLRKDLRDFGQAISALSQSVLLYRISGRRVEAARSLVSLSTAQYQSGQVDRAVQTIQLALLDLHPKTQPRLYFQARYNLALYLCESANYHQARELLSAEELYTQYEDEWTRLRLAWLEGKVALGLGEDKVAEQALQRARQGFTSRGNGYDSALVGLDLATLYLRQRRWLELERIAGEVTALMEARGIRREALVALSLLRKASPAAKEELSRSILQELTACLEQVHKSARGRAAAL